MNAYGTMVMVAVSARHPARTFGLEKLKSEEALPEEDALDDADEPAPAVDAEGGLCFTTWRRSSRAT